MVLTMSNGSIDYRAIRSAERSVRRAGTRTSMRMLEICEPELASYLMERGSDLYARLARACPRDADVRAIHLAAMGLTLICIEALRRSK
jgi:hypothetical protein